MRAKCLGAGIGLFLLVASLSGGASASQGSQDGQDVMLEEGEGRDLVVEKCTVCHDTARIRSTYRDEQAWIYVVNNMIERGAQVTPDEARRIVGYLFEHYGIH
jgi:hypothetical protein